MSIGNEYKYLKKPENLKENLRLGQEVMWDENDEIRIVYHIFPCLNIAAFFRPELKEYVVPKNLLTEVSNLNREIIEKSNPNHIEQLTYEMENSIYNCWLYMFAMTFHYQDKIEKRMLFEEMLNILKKLKCHEVETYNILFDSLRRYGEGYMLKKLYERMINFEVPISYIMYMTMVQILNKKESELTDQNELSNQSLFYKKRTFKTLDEPHCLTNKVTFMVEFKCIYCQKLINVEVVIYKSKLVML